MSLAGRAVLAWLAGAGLSSVSWAEPRKSLSRHIEYSDTAFPIKVQV